MKYMKTLSLLFVLTCLCLYSCQDSNADSDVEEWISLFNGKNLDGWSPKFNGQELGVNYNNRFSVEDGFLKVRYAEEDVFKEVFGHLFFKEKFSHYRLKAKYRFVGEQQENGPGWAYRNNGLMLHCQDPKTMLLDQKFPICLEMQLLGGDGTSERSNGNLCTPSSHVMMQEKLIVEHCINSSSKTYHGDDWVNVEAKVLGQNSFDHFVEGENVLSYSFPIVDAIDIDTNIFKANQVIEDGYISIQAETAPIDFASIELLNLCGCMDPKAKNYKTYYVKADNGTCVYK